MISSGTLPIDYEVGSQRYILSKSELRCIDSAKPDNNFTVALNQVNPNFFYHFSVNPAFIAALVYFAVIGGGMIVRTYRWLSGSVPFHSMDAGHLVLLCLIFTSIIYRSYRQLKQSPSFHFTGVFDNSIVCSIPFTRKTKAKAMVFLESMAKRIRECPPSNESVISLLSWYQLISQIEWSQLDASIKLKEVAEKNTKPVIINLLKHKT